jgi:hypothetical protein
MDLSPLVFKPAFMPEALQRASFAELNMMETPLKRICEKFFVMLVQTDPFVAADELWNVIQSLSDLICVFANDEDEEIGFDQIFPYLLVSVFVFGIDELLDIMNWTGNFADFAVGTTQFAMTHCEGVVRHIGGISEDGLRKMYERCVK